MLINYIQLGLGLNPPVCGFLEPALRITFSALRINDLNYIAKLHRQMRSLGMSIAVVTAVERFEGNQRYPQAGRKRGRLNV